MYVVLDYVASVSSKPETGLSSTATKPEAVPLSSPTSTTSENVSLSPTTSEEVSWPPPASEKTPDQPVSDSILTTIGKGDAAVPVIQDLKESLKGGMRMAEPHNPSSTPVYNKRLDPSVADFVPSTVMNRISNASTLAGMSSKGSSLLPTKVCAYSSSMNASFNNFLLDPESSEFVPSHFIPNGDPSNAVANGEVGVEGEEEYNQGWFGSKDIVKGFQRAAPKEAGDSDCELVLKAGAEMLIRVFNYPASFHEIGEQFKETLLSCHPSDSALINLAEMLIHWVRLH